MRDNHDGEANIEDFRFHFHSLDTRQRNPPKFVGKCYVARATYFSSNYKIDWRAIAPIASAIVENVEFENEDEMSNLEPNRMTDL